MISINKSSCSVKGVQKEISVFIDSSCCLLSYLLVSMHEYDHDIPLKELIERATKYAISIFFSEPNYVDVSNGWVKDPDGAIKAILGLGYRQLRIDNFNSVESVISNFEANSSCSKWLIARLGPVNDSHFVVVDHNMNLIWDPTTDSRSVRTKEVTSLRAVMRY